MTKLIFGPTNKFPGGKIDKDDEGELEIGIGEEDGNVILAFGTSVHWIGMTPLQAMHLAAALVARAKEIDPTHN